MLELNVFDDLFEADNRFSDKMISLAQLIQNHRKKAGLTQAELAQLAGIGKTAIWHLEHGKESAQWDTLQKIFRVLNIGVEWRSPLLDRTKAAASAEMQYSAADASPVASPAASASSGASAPSAPQ